MKSYTPIPFTYKLEFHILPFDSFTIHTKLSLEEVHLIMDSLVGGTLSMDSRKFFYGKLGRSSFSISPITGIRNSFLPRIKGDIAKKEEGCIIRITALPYPFVQIFMALWLTMGLFIWLSLLLSSQPLGSIVLEGGILLLFGWLFPSLCFWIPESRAKTLLITWFRNYDRSSEIKQEIVRK